MSSLKGLLFKIAQYDFSIIIVFNPFNWVLSQFRRQSGAIHIEFLCVKFVVCFPLTVIDSDWDEIENIVNDGIEKTPSKTTVSK
ncbi:MAG: hypothetical protein M3Q58_03380 [Bacteroidota bacterium]|nr:hypothetical protein [Bacteroidota bacterium]